MTDSLKIGKKGLTWFVVGATLLWTMSAVFVVAPLTVKAATMTAGDLIRGTVKSTYGGYPVYYYGVDGKKYLFPTESTYKTWYTDFSSVKVILQTELEAIGFGGNVTYKPAGRMVKFQGDMKAYAVDKGGTLRWVKTEDIAKALYGDLWYKPGTLDTVPEGFQANYKFGTDIAVATDFNKTTVAASAPDIGTDKGIGAAATTTGSVTIAIAADSPGAKVIPGTASGVTVLKVNLTAGASAATVTSLTVGSTGVGAAADFTNLYVYEGAVRLTSGRTLATQTKQATFSMSYTVPANTTKTISILADIGAVSGTATSGDTHAFGVVAVGGASVSGLPVTGATLSIGSQNVTTVTVAKGPDPANPTIGQKNVAIGAFKLTAGSNDVEFQRVTMTVGGTVSMSDLSNFVMYQAGTKVADGTVLSDRVTFVLTTPYILAQGLTRTFDVKADVAGRGSRGIALYIDSSYPSDLLVVDRVYNVGTGYTWTSFAAVRTTCSTTSVAGTPANDGTCVITQGGKLTVAFNGPSASDVTKGSQDAVLYKFALTAGDQAVEVKKFGVTIADVTNAVGKVKGATNNTFTDVKIKNVDTGAVVMGPKEYSVTAGVTTTGATPCASSSSLCYTDAWTLNAGQTVNLAVTADVRNTEDTAGDFFDKTFKVTTEAFGDTFVREVSTGQYVTAATNIVGYASNTGYDQTVRSSALTVSLSSSPTSQSTVKGTQGVEMMGFSFAAGTSSTAKITQIVLTGYSKGNAGSLTTYAVANLATDVLSATLWDGTTQVGTSKSPNASGVITFDNLTWQLGKGETRKLTVKVNAGTTLLSGSTSDSAYLGVATIATDVVAQDGDGNPITPSAGTTSPANATPTNVLTVGTSGTLTVSLDGDTPLSSLVAGNTTGVTVGKFNFAAATESFTISKLRVAVDGASTCYAASTTATTQNATNGSCDDGIGNVKLSYQKADNTTETVSCSLSSGIADCQGMSFFVPASKSRVLSVLIDTTNIAQLYTSGDAPVFGLDFDNNFKADGTSGSTLSTCAGLSATNGITCASGTIYTSTYKTDVNSNSILVHKTKPTLALATGSPSGGSAPKTNEEMLRFTVGADAAGDLKVSALYFKLTLSNVGGTWADVDALAGDGTTTNKIHLYDRSDLQNEIAGTWVLTDSSGATTAGLTSSWAKFTLTSPKKITANTSKTFSLLMNTSAATATTSSTTGEKLQVEIAVPTAVGGTALSGASNGAIGSGTTAYGIAWQETETGAYNDATAGANVYGTRVAGLPVVGGSISY